MMPVALLSGVIGVFLGWCLRVAVERANRRVQRHIEAAGYTRTEVIPLPSERRGAHHQPPIDGRGA